MFYTNVLRINSDPKVKVLKLKFGHGKNSISVK